MWPGRLPHPGRWKSVAYLVYIKIHHQQLAPVSSLLASSGATSSTHQSLSSTDCRCISKLCHLYKIVINLEDFRSPPISFKSQPCTRHSNSLALVLFMLIPLNSTFLFFLIPFLFGTPSVMIQLIHPLYLF